MLENLLISTTVLYCAAVYMVSVGIFNDVIHEKTDSESEYAATGLLVGIGILILAPILLPLIALFECLRFVLRLCVELFV